MDVSSPELENADIIQYKGEETLYSFIEHTNKIEGSEASFPVLNTVISYEWYTSYDGISWTNIANTKDYDLPIFTNNGTFYYKRITKAILTSGLILDTKESDVVEVDVSSPEIQGINSIAIQDSIITSKFLPSLSTAPDFTYTTSFLWQKSTNNRDWSNTIVTTIDYTTDNLERMKYYRREVTFTLGGTTITSMSNVIQYGMEIEVEDVYKIPNVNYIYIPKVNGTTETVTFKYSIDEEDTYSDFPSPSNILILDDSYDTLNSFKVKATTSSDSKIVDIPVYHSISLPDFSEIEYEGQTIALTIQENEPAVPEENVYTIKGSGNYIVNWKPDPTVTDSIKQVVSDPPIVTKLLINGVGTYILEINDKNNNKIKVTRKLKVTSPHVNVGFQGKTHTVGNNGNFIGNVYSKDDSTFHIFHRETSALLSTLDIPNKNPNLHYAPIHAANIESKSDSQISDTYRLTIGENDGYDVSSDGRTLVEVYDKYTTCSQLLFKYQIRGYTDIITDCVTLSSCSGSDSGYSNIKLCLDKSGDFALVSFKEAGVNKLIHLEKSSNAFVINTSFNINFTNSDPVIDIALYEDQYCCVLLDTHFYYIQIDINHISKHDRSTSSPLSIHVDHNGKLYILNSTKVFAISVNQTQYVPISTSLVDDSSGNHIIKISKTDSQSIQLYTNQNNYINYDNKSYEIVNLDFSGNQGTLVLKALPAPTLWSNNKSIYINTISESSINLSIGQITKPQIDDNGYIYYIYYDNDNDNYNIKYINQYDDTHNHLIYLDYTPDKLTVNQDSFTITEKDSSQNLLRIYSYSFNSFINIGHKSHNSHKKNNILLGNEIKSKNYQNQIIIGSRNIGLMDNSVQLGNFQTKHIIPSSNAQCNMGHVSYKLKAIYVNKINFGDDLMSFPSSDGEDNQVLTRKGKGQLIWSQSGAQYLDDIIDCHAPQDDTYNILLPSRNSNSAGEKHTPSGLHNTIIGFKNDDYAAYDNISGNDNVVLGFNSGNNLLYGSNNVILGSQSGQSITSGSNNVILGSQSGQNITSESNNILIGKGLSVGIGSENQIIIGNGANDVGLPKNNIVVLGNSQVTNIVPGNNGSCDLGHVNYKLQAIHVNKINFGDDLMSFPSSDGEDNQVLTRKGKGQLIWSQSGAQYLDDIIDCHAPQDDTYNILLPSRNSNSAGEKHTPSGLHNTIIGFKNDDYAAYDNISGNDNVVLGFNSGNNLLYGSNNVILGSQSGQNITSGSNNILIGKGSSVGSGSNDQIIIGNYANDNDELLPKNNIVVLGNSNVKHVVPGNNGLCDLGSISRKFNKIHAKESSLDTLEVESYIICKGSIASYSDARLKSNIEELSTEKCVNFISELRPVKFDYIHSKKSQLGFIAQEVAKSAEKHDIDDTLVQKDSDGMLSMNYQNIIAPLVKTIQAQNTIIEDLMKRIESLEEKINYK